MERTIRVLHLEDNPRDAELIASRLRATGPRSDLTLVSRREDFLAALRGTPFDVILCDHNLVGYDGTVALREAREIQPGVPILIISGTIGEEEAVRALHAGATDYLLKDRLQRLGSAVERAVHERQAVRARRAAEAALRESETRLRQFTDRSDDVFWLLALEPERITYVSPAAEQIWGLPLAAFYADARAWLGAIHHDDREHVERAFEALLTGEASNFEAEYRIVRPDGSVRRVLDRGVMIRDDGSGAYSVAGISRDVTAMRAIEEQLRHAQKMEAVGRLAGGIAHDFNNALTVILGVTELVAESLGDDHPCRQDLRAVCEAAECSARLTRQLLAFSRREIVHPVVMDVDAAIRKLEGLLKRTLGENIELVLRLSAGRGRVEADPGHFEQVLMNLVINARDAMASGGTVSIETAVTRLPAGDVVVRDAVPDGQYVCVSVGDTGRGMSAEVQAHVFEPFFTTKDPGKGTGLGLATVYGIVRQAGGTIAVCSEVGRGATFRVYLPSVVRPLSVAAEGEAPRQATTRAGQTILLVEDQELVLRLATRLLEREGYRVLAARTPSEAIAIASRHPGALDLLLTDVVLPEISGPALARALIEARPALRILYTSGYTSDAIGADDLLMSSGPLLHKPYTMATLCGAVARALSAGPERAEV